MTGSIKNILTTACNAVYDEGSKAADGLKGATDSFARSYIKGLNKEAVIESVSCTKYCVDKKTGEVYPNCEEQCALIKMAFEHARVSGL